MRNNLGFRLGAFPPPFNRGPYGIQNNRAISRSPDFDKDVIETMQSNDFEYDSRVSTKSQTFSGHKLPIFALPPARCAIIACRDPDVADKLDQSLPTKRTAHNTHLKPTLPASQAPTMLQRSALLALLVSTLLLLLALVSLVLPAGAAPAFARNADAGGALGLFPAVADADADEKHALFARQAKKTSELL